MEWLLGVHEAWSRNGWSSCSVVTDNGKRCLEEKKKVNGKNSSIEFNGLFEDYPGS
jgi:hypothetical protein